MEVDEMLRGRGANYGTFLENAKVVQGLKGTMRESKNWPSLSADKKEALDMIVSKMGSILNGNPDLHDSWLDIVGYARLVEQTLTPIDQKVTDMTNDEWDDATRGRTQT